MIRMNSVMSPYHSYAVLLKRRNNMESSPKKTEPNPSPFREEFSRLLRNRTVNLVPVVGTIIGIRQDWISYAPDREEKDRSPLIRIEFNIDCARWQQVDPEEKRGLLVILNRVPDSNEQLISISALTKSGTACWADPLLSTAGTKRQTGRQ